MKTLIFIFTLISSGSLSFASYAFACFCSYDQNVSDYMKDKKVFWGIPVSSQLKPRNGSRKSFNLVTETMVLEDFDQNLSQVVVINSLPEDGGSCGNQPKLGIPQLITMYSKGENHWGFNNCNCDIPYSAMKNFLENKTDTFIPNPEKCKESSEGLECDVWKMPQNEYNLYRSDKLQYFPITDNMSLIFDTED